MLRELDICTYKFMRTLFLRVLFSGMTGMPSV
nr:MAG TPA: hypothetical protein [Caudoviricetes sp.]